MSGRKWTTETTFAGRISELTGARMHYWAALFFSASAGVVLL